MKHLSAPKIYRVFHLNILSLHYYYRPKPVSASDLKLMRCMDELPMQYPFAGSRMMRDLLNRQGHPIGRRHTRTLMKK